MAKNQKEQILELQAKVQEFEAKELAWQEADKIKTEKSQSSINQLNTELSEARDEISRKQAQLDSRELKKLAQAFGEQEGHYKKDREKWAAYLLCSVGLLFLYAILCIIATQNMEWGDRFGYYAIDIIFVSAIWFCAAQFSEATKLMTDYGNRKTLAQSFHNILNNLTEDFEIKTKFIEKTTDILCAPIGDSRKEPILTKKIMKDLLEMAKIFTK